MGYQKIMGRNNNEEINCVKFRVKRVQQAVELAIFVQSDKNITPREDLSPILTHRNEGCSTSIKGFCAESEKT